YALVRPPGHHAEPDRGRGYCVFGNAVIAVRHAQRVHRLSRVAVVDWDVHHGNGTETAFLDDPSVLTISVHQDRCYPVDSGQLEVTGRGRAAYTNLNVPLPAGSGHGAYLAAFERAVVPALLRFRPELVVIASGLDANAMDPLGRMMATSATYRELARLVLEAAGATAGGRVVATHEGGYSNAYVPFCGLAVVEAFAGSRSAANDPYLEELMAQAGHALLPHQAALIDAAAEVAARVPAPA
ncbi:MAG: class II histone deacetylase, partial [Proteobacteria bacterium]|nr:class II histone deacetylase [Pseudomonadota bacterium]